MVFSGYHFDKSPIYYFLQDAGECPRSFGDLQTCGRATFHRERELAYETELSGGGGQAARTT